MRHVLVVKEVFVGASGAIMAKGDRITDEGEKAFAKKHHPEKVIASLHDHDDEPADEPVADEVAAGE